MAGDWPKWSEMNWLRLLEGPSGGTTLPVAPTMPHLTYRGERYFRMKDARGGRHPGGRGGRTHYGGLYLWDGWWAVMLAKARSGALVGDGDADAGDAADHERRRGVIDRPAGRDHDRPVG
jgi:hypothetical protein